MYTYRWRRAMHLGCYTWITLITSKCPWRQPVARTNVFYFTLPVPLDCSLLALSCSSSHNDARCTFDKGDWLCPASGEHLALHILTHSCACLTFQYTTYCAYQHLLTLPLALILSPSIKLYSCPCQCLHPYQLSLLASFFCWRIHLFFLLSLYAKRPSDFFPDDVNLETSRQENKYKRTWPFSEETWRMFQSKSLKQKKI